MREPWGSLHTDTYGDTKAIEVVRLEANERAAGTGIIRETIPTRVGSQVRTTENHPLRQGERMKVCDPIAGALSGRARAPKPCRTQQRAGSHGRMQTDLRDR